MHWNFHLSASFQWRSYYALLSFSHPNLVLYSLFAVRTSTPSLGHGLPRGCRTDRYKFLGLLKRDLLQHVACYSCARLYSIERAHQYDCTNPENRSINGHRRPCFKEDWSFRAREVIHRHFSYPLFQST
jgi:hypothetical protein